MEKNLTVLDRLKGLRESFGFSESDMAAAADVSLEEYKKLEAGEIDLSFSFLFKCATKFGVDISSLVTGEEPRLSEYTLVRKGDGMPIKRREEFNYLHLAYLMKERLAEPLVVTAKYSAELEDAPIKTSTHSGQEFDYVLKGELKITIDGHTEILHTGDSLFYDAMKEHGMIATGGSDCEFIAVVIKGNVEDNTEPVTSVKETSEQKPVAEEQERFYKKFVDETLDENGHLKDIKFKYPDNFNFGYDVVDAIAEKSPNKEAMLWVNGETDEDTSFSFSDVSKYSAKAANYFTRLGIKKGDKVMLVLRRHYQFWYSIIALNKIGAIVIPGTDQLTTKDFVYRFNAAGIRAIVCTSYGEAAKMVDEAMAESPTMEIKSIAYGAEKNPALLANGWSDFDSEIEKESDVFPRSNTMADEPMLMYFTSGTTGYPKIVTHSFTYPLAHIVTACWWHNVDPEGLHFTVSDTGWAKAVWGKIYGQWICEAAIFVCDFMKFNPVDILPMFKKYKITTFCAPPTIFRYFIKEDLTKFDLSSLKYATIAGEALNPEVFQQFYDATGIKLMEGFGQTETILLIANLIGMEPKPGSMGKPQPAFDVIVIDAEGNEINAGETGEICVSTKNGIPLGMFSGYYCDDNRTKEVWHDGIYHTGDMAWKDEDGYLWYVGRTDDLIKSSGYRIGPFEVESVLMEMPCITECAITGVPDELRGQVIKATIVLSKGYTPSDELKKEIQTYVKEHTAPYKYPRVIEFVESLPKTISGKIRRVEIRENS